MSDDFDFLLALLPDDDQLPRVVQDIGDSLEEAAEGEDGLLGEHVLGCEADEDVVAHPREHGVGEHEQDAIHAALVVVRGLDVQHSQHGPAVVDVPAQKHLQPTG